MPYRLEAATTSRAGCNGKKPCKGTKIEKGELRFGTWVVIPPHESGSFKWRHWGCVTPEVLANLKNEIPEASEIDGFDELPPVYQEKVTVAWEAGEVAEEDIPESAKVKPKEGEEAAPEQEKPKKASKAKKAAKEEPEAEEPEAKPKKAKKSAKKTEEVDVEEEKPAKAAPKKRKSKAAEEEPEEEEKPKSKMKKGSKTK